MTFIISIQLNDSVIITADTKNIVLTETNKIQFDIQKLSKIYQWDKGIITGTGEYHVITKSIELFKELAHSDITRLPQCLDLSRQIREFEVGISYFQIENTKLLCTSYSENGAQLYKIERYDSSRPYTLTDVKPYDITIWLFHPDIDAISEDLQNLYANLKDATTFSNQLDWINHYINHLALIYRKQSRVDPLMSQSFDFFFQTKNEYITGHIPNTQEIDIKFNDISTNSASI
jgi:hypothetical protein